MAADVITLAPEPHVVSPPTTDALFERLLRDEDDWKDAHKRLRETLVDLADQLDAVKVCQANMRLDADRVKAKVEQPPDFTRSVLPTRLWVTVLGGTLAVVMTIVGAAYSVKSDVRDQSTRQEAESRLNDERIATLKQAIDDLKKDGALQRIQLESLTKMVIQQRRD